MEPYLRSLNKYMVDHIVCDANGWYYDNVTMCHVNIYTNKFVTAETLARWFESRKEKENKMNNIENIRNQAAVLLAEADRLANLPDEPDCDVIYFRKRFHNVGIYYTYAAVKIMHDSWLAPKWYVSGSRSAPQDVIWDRLIEWICRPEDEWEIWTSVLTPLISSDGLFSDSYDE